MFLDKNRKKGNITAFTVMILAFISWAVFSASFLISGELQVLNFQKTAEAEENKKIFLEVIFLKTIDEIENYLSENPETKDIIWYFFKKGNKLLWTENYNNYVESDTGFFINKIIIRRSFSDETTYEFSETSKHFKYTGLIANNSIPSKSHSLVVYFSKELKNLFVEDMGRYNIRIEGQAVIEYYFNKVFNEEAVTSCEIKELHFEIYED